jgi:acetyltransferase-like isoleucine patch superfamily enzyme
MAPRIQFQDPLVLFAREREEIASILARAANAVGANVMVGDCTLWGGRGPNVVGLRLGDNVRLYDGCRLVIDHLSPDSGITLGTGVALNFNCYIDGSGGVKLGDRTILGPNVVIVSSSHGVAAELRDTKTLRCVTLGRQVWVGANAVILSGVTIGDHAVIGAGSVVNKDVPANHIYAGNPARPISEIGQNLANQISPRADRSN